MNPIEPLRDSQISVQRDRNDFLLSWRKPSSAPVRYLISAFLLFWLCGWSIGTVLVLKRVFSSGGSLFPRVVVPVMFLSIAGISCAILYALLRPQKPEAIRLGQNRLTYDTGTSLPDFLNPRYMLDFQHNLLKTVSLKLKKQKTYTYARTECPEFVLEGIGREQRLRFDDGAERITVGWSLTEPEREWLARHISEWRHG